MNAKKSEFNSVFQLVKRIEKFPFSNWLLNQFIYFKIPFVKTGRLRIIEMSQNRVRILIPNTRPVQNHIAQVHAAAMVLLAETCSGLLVGMNVKDESLPLVKAIDIQYVKRSSGKLSAEAVLSNEQGQCFDEAKGEIQIPVKITDAQGIEPVIVICHWAWVPKKASERKEDFR